MMMGVAFVLERRGVVIGSQTVADQDAAEVFSENETGKNLGVHAATAWIGDDSEGDHRVYLPSSPLSSAQRAWSNICAPGRVQRICCFFSIRLSTSWSTVDSTRAVDS